MLNSKALQQANGILYFTDFHAHLFMEFAKPYPDPMYVTDRFKQQMDVLEHMLTVAKDQQLIVIFGGDLFHKRGAVDVRVYNNVYRLFAQYSKQIPGVFLLRGNHDSYDNSMDSESSLDTFQYLPNVEVVSNPREYGFGGDGDGDAPRVEIGGKPLTLTFMPYGEDITEMQDYMEEAANALSPDSYNILVAHLGVDGSKQGRSTHRLPGAFTKADLHPDKFDTVLLGHFHARQHLEPNMWYGGSTMQLTFNDEDEEKGYDIMDSDGNWTFYPLATPQFITLTDPNKLTDKDWLKAHDDDYIRAQIPDTLAKEIKDQLPEEIKATTRIEAQTTSKAMTRIDIEADDSPAKVVSTYMDKYNPDLKSLALDVLKEAVDSYRNC